MCSSLDEEKNLIVSKLHLYRRPYGVSTHLAKYKDYLENHLFSDNVLSNQQIRDAENVPASVVDPNR